MKYLDTGELREGDADAREEVAGRRRVSGGRRAVCPGRRHKDGVGSPEPFAQLGNVLAAVSEQETDATMSLFDSVRLDLNPGS